MADRRGGQRRRVVVRSHQPMMSLPTFVTPEPFQVGQTVTLGEDEAHHIRVLRLELGQLVGLRDGRGTSGAGPLVRLAKRHAAVTVEEAIATEPPPSVHLLLPVADRERMLWLAEKATELGATSWRPVMWKRSKSVSPRGEGSTFNQKVAARMGSALGQSRAAWLPVLFPESTVERAIAAAPEGARFVLDAGGEPIAPAILSALGAPPASSDAGTGVLPPITLAVGPEGGFEEAELAMLRDGGFRAVSIGQNILRFETAAVAALAVARAAIAAIAAGPGAVKT